MLKDLKDLLKKYTYIVPRERVVKDAVKEVINEMFSLSLKDSDISYSRNTVFLHIGGTAKSIIFMRKKKVLENLKNKMGKKAPKDLH